MNTVKLRVATRGSKLSQLQTIEALDYFSQASGVKLDYELVIVKTRGDIHQDKAFTEIGGKGVFEREVNLAVLKNEADIAVHSLKDVPSQVHPRLVLAGVPPRRSPHDVLVVRSGGMKTIWDLPLGAVVGTSSARRAAFIKRVRSDLVVKPLRGNVDTRILKLDRGDYDAIIVAEAGLQRLGLTREYWRIPVEVLPPAVGQGIVGVYTLAASTRLVSFFRQYSDKKTLIEALAERAFLAYAGGGCHTALGGYAVYDRGALRFTAAVASPDGSKAVWVSIEGEPDKPAALGLDAAFMLRSKAREAGIPL